MDLSLKASNPTTPTSKSVFDEHQVGHQLSPHTTPSSLLLPTPPSLPLPPPPYGPSRAPLTVVGLPPVARQSQAVRQRLPSACEEEGGRHAPSLQQHHEGAVQLRALGRVAAGGWEGRGGRAEWGGELKQAKG